MKSSWRKSKLLPFISIAGVVIACVVAVLTVLLLQNTKSVSPTQSKASALPAPTFTWSTPQALTSTYLPRQALWSPDIAVRPTDGRVFILSESASGYTTPDLVIGAGETMLIDASAPLAYTSKSNNINDSGATNTTKFVDIDFGIDGTGYAVWRQQPPNQGWRAWMRTIPSNITVPLPPNVTLPQGKDLGSIYKRDSKEAELDQPAIAASKTTVNKIYVTGQVQTSAAGWGIAESLDGGNTFQNFYKIAKNRPADGGDIKPKICVDKNDNIHTIAFWNHTALVSSKYNGTWLPPVTLASRDNPNAFVEDRGVIGIACGDDGYAYALWQGDPKTGFGIARFTPGAGWKVVSYGALPNVYSKAAKATVAPDGTLYVIASTNAGAKVLTSLDKGQTFTETIVVPGSLIGGTTSNTETIAVNIAYSLLNKSLQTVTTFQDPKRGSFYAFGAPIVPTPTATNTIPPTATQTKTPIPIPTKTPIPTTKISTQTTSLTRILQSTVVVPTTQLVAQTSSIVNSPTPTLGSTISISPSPTIPLGTTNTITSTKIPTAIPTNNPTSINTATPRSTRNVLTPVPTNTGTGGTGGNPTDPSNLPNTGLMENILIAGGISIAIILAGFLLFKKPTKRILQ
jgi:LPXTG-motif cell wall-anchored protein